MAKKTEQQKIQDKKLVRLKKEASKKKEKLSKTKIDKNELIESIEEVNVFLNTEVVDNGNLDEIVDNEIEEIIKNPKLNYKKDAKDEDKHLVALTMTTLRAEIVNIMKLGKSRNEIQDLIKKKYGKKYDSQKFCVVYNNVVDQIKEKWSDDGYAEELKIWVKENYLNLYSRNMENDNLKEAKAVLDSFIKIEGIDLVAKDKKEIELKGGNIKFSFDSVIIDDVEIIQDILPENTKEDDDE